MDTNKLYKISLDFYLTDYNLSEIAEDGLGFLADSGLINADVRDGKGYWGVEFADGEEFSFTVADVAAALQRFLIDQITGNAQDLISMMDSRDFSNIVQDAAIGEVTYG